MNLNQISLNDVDEGKDKDVRETESLGGLNDTTLS